MANPFKERQVKMKNYLILWLEAYRRLVPDKRLFPQQRHFIFFLSPFLITYDYLYVVFDLFHITSQIFLHLSFLRYLKNGTSHFLRKKKHLTKYLIYMNENEINKCIYEDLVIHLNEHIHNLHILCSKISNKLLYWENNLNFR